MYKIKKDLTVYIRLFSMIHNNNITSDVITINPTFK